MGPKWYLDSQLASKSYMKSFKAYQIPQMKYYGGKWYVSRTDTCHNVWDYEFIGKFILLQK